MSSQLFDEISQLVAHARHQQIHPDSIEELTVIAGYAYLLQFQPESREHIRQHLAAFRELVCARGHLGLYEQASKIIEIMKGSERTDDAA